MNPIKKYLFLSVLLCLHFSLLAQKPDLAKSREGEAMTFEECQIPFCEAKIVVDINRVVCEGTKVTLQAEEVCTEHLYRWLDGNTGQYLGSGVTLKPTVFKTTVFVLEVVAPGDDIVTRDEVVVNVLINDSYPTDLALVPEEKLSLIQVPPEPGGIAELQMTLSTIWGFTYAENYNDLMEIEVDLCSDGEKWRPILKNVVGPYSIQYRLLSGVQEVTGIEGNTSELNYCEQVENMDLISKGIEPTPLSWYVIKAVQDHEEVHLSRFLPALLKALNVVERNVEAPISYLDDRGQDIETAKREWQEAHYRSTNSIIYLQWQGEINMKIANDHDLGGPTEQAERAVVVPIITNICCHAKSTAWMACTHCSSFDTDCE